MLFWAFVFLTMNSSKEQKIYIAFAFGLVALTVITLWPTLSNGWVNWDDEGYVLDNPLVHHLSWNSIRQMFTTTQIMGLYHPLTLISLAADYHLAGANPMMFHVSNLILHLINVILVFAVFRSITKSNTVSFVTALLFAVHPMHIESVAWISSRKDLLYVMFFFLGIRAYLEYHRSVNYTSRWYILTILLFVSALLSKATAVIFPVVLLLFDYLENRKFTRRILFEKVPFFVLALIFGGLAIYTQQEGNALQSEHTQSVLQRAVTGIYGLTMYLIKAIIPFKLSAFHPYPNTASGQLPGYFYVLLIPIIGLTIYLVKQHRHNRQIVFGLGFFLVSILPLVQFFPVGQAIIADRYSYISYIGLFYLAGLLVSGFTENKVSVRSNLYLSMSIVYAVVLMLLAFQRSKVWMNGNSLWTDVIEKYPDDYFAYGSRANYWMGQGNLDAALVDYNASIERFPCFAEALNNRGLIYWQMGDDTEAMQSFNQAIQCDITIADAYTNRGLIFLNQGKYDLAMLEFNRSIELDQTVAAVYYNRGLVFQRLEDVINAVQDYSTAIHLDPENSFLYKERAKALRINDNYSLAMQDANTAIGLNHVDGEAFFLRSLIQRDLGEYATAMADAIQADRLGFSVSNEYIADLRNSINSDQ